MVGYALHAAVAWSRKAVIAVISVATNCLSISGGHVCGYNDCMQSTCACDMTEFSTMMIFRTPKSCIHSYYIDLIILLMPTHYEALFHQKQIW